MRIFVQAKPAAKKAKVERIDAAHFIIAVKERPQEGRANRALAKALAEYLGVAPSRVRLVSGISAKQKVFKILN